MDITRPSVPVHRGHISCEMVLLGASTEKEILDCPWLDFLHIYLPNFNSVDVCRQNQVLSECTTDSIKNHLLFLCWGFNIMKVARFTFSRWFGDFRGRSSCFESFCWISREAWLENDSKLLETRFKFWIFHRILRREIINKVMLVTTKQMANGAR